jgi:nucleotide-binding universal stress UspA family protein
MAFGYMMPGFGYVPVSREQQSGDARALLDRAIDEALGSSPVLGICREAIAGHPASILVEASRSADLLVLGDRGGGGFVELLLGSVAEHCVRNAACSVVVVREKHGVRPHPPREV